MRNFTLGCSWRKAAIFPMMGSGFHGRNHTQAQGPRSPCPICSSSSSTAPVMSRMPWARSEGTLPASVSRMLREPRWNRGQPQFFLQSFIWVLRGGWEMWSTLAAADMLPSLTMAVKYSIVLYPRSESSYSLNVYHIYKNNILYMVDSML